MIGDKSSYARAAGVRGRIDSGGNNYKKVNLNAKPQRPIQTYTPNT